MTDDVKVKVLIGGSREEALAKALDEFRTSSFPGLKDALRKGSDDSIPALIIFRMEDAASSEEGEKKVEVKRVEQKMIPKWALLQQWDQIFDAPKPSSDEEFLQAALTVYENFLQQEDTCAGIFVAYSKTPAARAYGGEEKALVWSEAITATEEGERGVCFSRIFVAKFDPGKKEVGDLKEVEQKVLQSLRSAAEQRLGRTQSSWAKA